MDDPNADEPPLVLRPEQGADAPRSPDQEADAPRATKPVARPRPGFWEAVAWCLVFVGAQMFGAIVAVAVVVTAHAMAAPNPKQFVDEQLDGFMKALDPRAQGPRPPVPPKFAEALAYGMLTAQFVSLGLIALVLPRRIGPNWKREIGVRAPHRLHVGLVLLIVPGFLIFAGVIQEAFLWATGVRPPPAMRALNGVFGGFPWPLTVLAVALGPGVVEEFWCRGFLGRGLSARYGLVAGVLITSALFALMHVDPSQLFVIALMGAYLHFVYVATRSIWAPILLHAMNNGISILLVLTLKSEQLDQEKHVPIVVTLVSLSLMIFGTVALWTSRAELEPVTRQDEAWLESDGWKPEYPGVSAPPPDANVRLVYAPVSPAALMFTILSFGILMYLGYRYLI